MSSGTPAPDPARTQAELERLAADTDRLRARLGPGDGPDALRAIIAAASHGRG